MTACGGLREVPGRASLARSRTYVVQRAWHCADPVLPSPFRNTRTMQTTNPVPATGFSPYENKAGAQDALSLEEATNHRPPFTFDPSGPPSLGPRTKELSLHAALFAEGLRVVIGNT